MDLSVIVPAYNEELLLKQTLTALQRAIKETGRSAELIVVDNNSTDRTADIARTSGARVVFEPHNQISRARNAGAAVAHGGYLFFIDADTTVSSQLLNAALENLDGGACAGGAQIRFDRPLTGIAAAATRAWNGISERLGLAAGCFLFCRRDAFEQVGGFSAAVYASEELWLSGALKKWGRGRKRRFVILTEVGPVTSSRKFQWFSPARLALSMLVAFIPFSIRSRRLCGFWYKRPR